MSLTDWPGGTRFLRKNPAILSTSPQGKAVGKGPSQRRFPHFPTVPKLAEIPAGISLRRGSAEHRAAKFSTRFSTGVDNLGSIRIPSR
jgi:hypothetical protein